MVNASRFVEHADYAPRMPLYRNRERQKLKSEKAASGEAVSLTTGFAKKTRTRLYWAMQNSTSDWAALANAQLAMLREDWGKDWLIDEYVSTDREHIKSFVIDYASPASGEMLDVIEAYLLASEDRLHPEFERDTFRTRANAVLDEEGIAFQVVGKEIVPRESMAMHATVIAPVLHLLHGTPGLEKVERTFHAALLELKEGGDPGDAITDAGTALQEMLNARGASGNALGPLLADAKKKGVLGPFDSKLAEGAKLVGDWVSANRSERGDAHAASDADRNDAWLAVHVAGAMILWLEQRL